MKVSSEVFDAMVSVRRDLHQHPELSWQESRTAERICQRLNALGIPYRSGIAGTGIIADLPGQEAGPSVALRADTDALPVIEETGLPFASTRPGVMHACGHDGHTSMLLGAAHLLKQGPLPPRPVRLIWQPAEETGRGAPAMIKAGCLEGVGCIFGGHLDRHFPPGSLAITEGAVNASTDMFEITIHGKGGHGARPHEAIDAVVVGSLLITALQTIVSREINPAHPSVISVGRFVAGTAGNVIASRAELAGTIRSQDQKTREHLKASLDRIARAVGQLHDAAIDVQILDGTPALLNSDEMITLAREAGRRAVGEAQLDVMRTANMGGEDFAYYLEHVPGCYIRYGGQVAGRESFPAHSSQFDFDERALASGAAWLYEIAHVGGAWLRGQTNG